MIQTIKPGMRTGCISAPSSKSQAHRYLICAALAGNETEISCPGISKDIEATMACLNGLGADISADSENIHVSPVRQSGKNEEMLLRCGESGSTLRFLLPVAGALGVNAVFVMEGRLSQRPMEQYEKVLMDHGMNITRDGNYLHVSGQLLAGEYSLPGNVSSQYFSGLLFALPLLKDSSRIIIEGRLESADYVVMTENALAAAGITWNKTENGYAVPGNQKYAMPGYVKVEGDYSNAAFFLCAGAMSEKGITVNNLIRQSGQGDRRIAQVLADFGADVRVDDDGITVKHKELKGIDIDGSMIPDLIPVLCVTAAAADGETRVFNAGRLRMKESDRIESTVKMLKALGADAEETADGMIIRGHGTLAGGTVDACGDHRIAMAAAAAACVCGNSVTVNGSESVEKSYPKFWDDYGSLEVC